MIKVESNSKFWINDIKNCTCYYIDDIIKFENFDTDNIAIDEKSCKNIMIF